MIAHKYRIKPAAGYLIILLLLATALPVQAMVSARLSTRSVPQGQPVRLTIEMQSEQSASPDLSVLERDFEILERATQQSISIINGKMSSKHSLVLTLLPKANGSLTIPPISVGSEQTAPLTLEVSEQAADQPGSKALARVELSLNKQRAYPQEEVLLTLRLIRQANVRAEHLDDPVSSLDDTRIQLLDEQQYTSEENGEIYRVLERTYALYAYQTGRLEISPIGFRGRSGGRSVFSLLNDPFSRNLTPQRFIQTASDAVSLEIMPIPAAFNGTHWLPAKQLLLEDTGIDPNTPVTAGKPITRRIILVADGLMASQLPTISQEVPAEIKPYEERPQLKDTPGKSGISGSRQSVITLIPTKAGHYTLPPMEIPWWNLETEREEIARLPAVELEVTAAPATAQPAVIPHQATTDSVNDSQMPAAREEMAEASPAQTTQESEWNWLIWFFAAAWLATLAGWVISHRKKDMPASTSADKPVAAAAKPDQSQLDRAVERLKQAYAEADADAARTCWLQWGQLTWPEQPPKNLTRLASRCEGELASAILALEKALYSPDEESAWRDFKLTQLTPGQSEERSPTEPQGETLLPLNP